MSEPRDSSRRDFVVGASAVVALGAGALDAPAAHRLAVATALTDLSATEAVAQMTSGELSCEQYATALLERCAQIRALNAFISLNPAQVLADARQRDAERRAGHPPGLLFGLPIPVKDSVNTRDYPTTAGTPALRHFHPAADAPLVAILRDAGAIVLGKTNLHELSYGWTSNNLSYGAVHNPYDPQRIPGGSSGGTAAAVAARAAPLGIAEDTEGSIRVPAALCGIVGLRPTTGRYPTSGCVPISPLFDQAGPHARCVADVALFDRVVAKDTAPLAAADLRGVRLGVVRDYWFTGLDREIERVTAAALSKLTAAGVTLVESRLPGLQHLIDAATLQVQDHDVRVSLAEYLKAYGAGISFEELVAQASPDIRTYFAGNVVAGAKNQITEAVYLKARDEALPALRTLLLDYFARERVDAIVFPTTMVAAPMIGDEDMLDIDGRKVPFTVAIARNIDPGSTAGLPGLVLPAGMTATGLPVSIELDAPAGADRRLLALGSAVENVLGHLQPPLV
jgi:indoleacetamide hydrolase